MTKWLYSLDSTININSRNEEAFQYSCSNGHINVTKWLTEICDDYQIEKGNGKIKGYIREI